MTHLRWLLLRPEDYWQDAASRAELLRLPDVRVVLARDGWVLARVDRVPVTRGGSPRSPAGLAPATRCSARHSARSVRSTGSVASRSPAHRARRQRAAGPRSPSS